MIKLRKAKNNDMDLLYRWANDPLVRKNSFNSDTISYDDHKKWFKKIMSDETVQQYIMERNGIPIGQIRLTISGNSAEVGYSIDRDYRAQGYGHIIIDLISEEVNNNHPDIKRLVAKVKKENMASAKLFESAGYEMVYEFSLDTKWANND